MLGIIEKKMQLPTLQLEVLLTLVNVQWVITA
jgi:hypothetical protein